MAGRHDHLQLRRQPANLLQRGESFRHPVRIGRQAQIHDGQARLIALHHRQCLLAAVRKQGVVGREGPAVLVAQPDIVFDNQ